MRTAFACLRYIGVFLIGIAVGLEIRTSHMNKLNNRLVEEYAKLSDKEKKLYEFSELVKNKNNQMVENLSVIYNSIPHDTNEITEVDEMLFDMWMD